MNIKERIKNDIEFQAKIEAERNSESYKEFIKKNSNNPTHKITGAMWYDYSQSVMVCINCGGLVGYDINCDECGSWPIYM